MRTFAALVLVGLLTAAPRAWASGGPVATVPVLLVPGWFDTDRGLAALRIRMIGAGWRPEEVATVSFSDPTGSNRAHALAIDSAARELLRSTGARQLDIVAHSMGGLATRWYLLGEDRMPVRRVVFIGSPHEGTYSAYLAWGEGGVEMKPGSGFLDTLNAASPVPSGVEAITIRTPLDTRVLPGESASLEGVPDFSVCCPSHAGMLRDPEVFQIARRFLQAGEVGPDPRTSASP